MGKHQHGITYNAYENWQLSIFLSPYSVISRPQIDFVAAYVCYVWFITPLSPQTKTKPLPMTSNHLSQTKHCNTQIKNQGSKQVVAPCPPWVKLTVGKLICPKGYPKDKLKFFNKVLCFHSLKRGQGDLLKSANFTAWHHTTKGQLQSAETCSIRAKIRVMTNFS